MLTTRMATVLARGACLALLGGLVACVDPEGKFDEFEERRALSDDMSSAGAGDAGGGEYDLPTPEQVSGRYVYAVTTQFGPTMPVLSELEVEAKSDGEGLELRIRDRFLSAADRQTPVSDWTEWRTDSVNADGTYTSSKVSTTTPAAANPVSGTETVSELVFTGRIDGAGPAADGLVMFWCGKVAGTLLRPEAAKGPLMGGFTAQRIVDDKNYPDPVINCDKDPAAPLP